MAIALIMTTVFVALVVYGLERNERRQRGPRPPLAGSSNALDRDLERVRDELIALSAHDRSADASPRRAAPSARPAGLAVSALVRRS